MNGDGTSLESHAELQLGKWIGRRLRELRAQRGWSVRDMTKLDARLTESHLHKYERGDTCPSLKNIRRLAKLFQISVAELLAADEDMARGYRAITALRDVSPKEYERVVGALEARLDPPDDSE